MVLKVVSAVLLLLLVLGVLIHYVGPSHWNKQHFQLRQILTTHSEPPTVTRFDPAELNSLPEPVQRYFNKVLKSGQPIITAVKVRHHGEFNMGESAENWRPFDSQQWVSTQHPGFLWDARISLLPTITVFVRDAFISGQGFLTAKLWGGITVMKAPQTPELAQGELMRFFAEAAWYPTALLPSQGVHWQAINDHQAEATLKNGDIAIQLIFTFNETALIESVHATSRYRAVDNHQVPTPWQGRFWNYQLRDGIWVPLSAEVAWQLPNGPHPYWRGHIDSLSYTFSP